MKQDIYIEKRAFSPNGQIFKEAVAVFEKTNHEVSLPFTNDRIIAAILPALHIGSGSQHLGRDGPPGRARSPGTSFMQGGSRELFTTFNTTIIQPDIYKTKIRLFTINF